MSQPVPPPWGTDWKPTPPAPTPARRGPGNPNWKAGGESPNPRGRPPGRADRRLLATEQMLDELKTIIEVQVAKAREGDSGAAALVMARVLPPVRPETAKVSFEFDATASISAQVSAVLDGIARGQVSPDVGRTIIDSIAKLADVRATEELAARLDALEERLT